MRSCMSPIVPAHWHLGASNQRVPILLMFWGPDKKEASKAGGQRVQRTSREFTSFPPSSATRPLPFSSVRPGSLALGCGFEVLRVYRQQRRVLEIHLTVRGHAWLPRRIANGLSGFKLERQAVTSNGV